MASLQCLAGMSRFGIGQNTYPLDVNDIICVSSTSIGL